MKSHVHFMLEEDDSSGSSLKESLNTTNDKLGAEFDSINDRKTNISSIAKKIKQAIDEVKKREPEYLIYAESLKNRGSELSKNRERFYNKINIENEEIDQQIAEFTKLYEEIFDKYTELSSKLVLVKSSVDDIRFNIERSEKQSDNMQQRIELYTNKAQVLQNSMITNENESQIQFEMKKTKNKIINIQNEIETTEHKVTRMTKHIEDLHKLNITQKNQERSLKGQVIIFKDKSEQEIQETNYHIKQVTNTKKKFQNSYNTDFQFIRNSKRKKKEFVDSISTAKQHAIKVREQIRNKDIIIESIIKEIKESKAETNRLQSIIDIYKNSKTFLEANKLIKIRSVIDEIKEHKHEIGKYQLEMKQCKMNERQLKHTLQKIKIQFDDTKNCSKLIHKAQIKIKEMIEKYNNNETIENQQIDKLTSELFILNKHIAVARSAYEKLYNHQFISLSFPETDIDDTDDNFQDKIEQTNNKCDLLRIKIKKLQIDNAQKQKSCIFIYPNYSSQPIYHRNKDYSQSDKKCEIDCLEAKVEAKKQQILRKKLNLDQRWNFLNVLSCGESKLVHRTESYREIDYCSRYCQSKLRDHKFEERFDKAAINPLSILYSLMKNETEKWRQIDHNYSMKFNLDNWYDKISLTETVI